MVFTLLKKEQFRGSTDVEDSIFRSQFNDCVIVALQRGKIENACMVAMLIITLHTDLSCPIVYW